MMEQLKMLVAAKKKRHRLRMYSLLGWLILVFLSMPEQIST